MRTSFFPFDLPDYQRFIKITVKGRLKAGAMFVEQFERYWGGLPLFLAAVASYLTWRFWSFTIRPALYPDEPKQLPYWIPSEYLPAGFLSVRVTNNTLSVLGTFTQ